MKLADLGSLDVHSAYSKIEMVSDGQISQKNEKIEMFYKFSLYWMSGTPSNFTVVKFGISFLFYQMHIAVHYLSYKFHVL